MGWDGCSHSRASDLLLRRRTSPGVRGGDCLPFHCPPEVVFRAPEERLLLLRAVIQGSGAEGLEQCRFFGLDPGLDQESSSRPGGAFFISGSPVVVVPFSSQGRVLSSSANLDVARATIESMCCSSSLIWGRDEIRPSSSAILWLRWKQLLHPGEEESGGMIMRGLREWSPLWDQPISGPTS